MKGAWHRDIVVTIKPQQQGVYERIQPQDGGSVGALQPLRRQYRRDAGKRNSQHSWLPQRRGSSGGALSFFESGENRGAETRGIRRLPRISAQKVLKAAHSQHPGLRVGLYVFFFTAILLLSGCGHKQRQVAVPAPPPIQQSTPQAPPAPPPPTAKEEDERIEVPAGVQPIFVETGLASWYGAPYHNRRGSNGEVYNMHAMTAAHRTLPLGSIVRITNVKSGRSAIVRITDRGPFVEGRIVDLSLAAAKAVDVYLPGIAKIKLEVLKAPAALDTGGRWAVQIGGFTHEKNADALSDHLQRRYQTAKVQCFRSPVGSWWVRARVLNDDRSRAEALARETETLEGSVFLVRLD
jgi:peptidoglycan lytic transglycosylase